MSTYVDYALLKSSMGNDGEWQKEMIHICISTFTLFSYAGHLHLKGSAEKMSKSLNNYITIKVKC